MLPPALLVLQEWKKRAALPMMTMSLLKWLRWPPRAPPRHKVAPPHHQGPLQALLISKKAMAQMAGVPRKPLARGVASPPLRHLLLLLPLQPPSLGQIKMSMLLCPHRIPRMTSTLTFEMTPLHNRLGKAPITVHGPPITIGNINRMPGMGRGPISRTMLHSLSAKMAKAKAKVNKIRQTNLEVGAKGVRGTRMIRLVREVHRRTVVEGALPPLHHTRGAKECIQWPSASLAVGCMPIPFFLHTHHTGMEG